MEEAVIGKICFLVMIVVLIITGAGVASIGGFLLYFVHAVDIMSLSDDALIETCTGVKESALFSSLADMCINDQMGFVNLLIGIWSAMSLALMGSAIPIIFVVYIIKNGMEIKFSQLITMRYDFDKAMKAFTA